MKNNPLKISKKERAKGDDGFKTFSIRVKDGTVADLDAMTIKTDRSRNEIINILLEYAILNSEIEIKK